MRSHILIMINICKHTTELNKRNSFYIQRDTTFSININKH